MSIFSRQRAGGSAEASHAQGTVTGIDANDTLNIRTAPGAGNQLVGRLRNGEGVEVVESRGTWVRIRSARGEGWVSGAYVSTQQQDPGQGRQQSGGGQQQEAQEQEQRPGFWARLFGRGGGDRDADTGGGGARASSGLPRDLKRLLDRDNLSAAQVQQARAMIERLPMDQQAEAWEELQEATPYINQLSVKDMGPRHGRGSAQVQLGPVICNLTSLAMCMQVLGIPNPDPSKPYPMALEAIRVRVCPDTWRGDEASWARIAPHVGIALSQISSGDYGKALSRSFWQGRPLRTLQSGGAVIASISGHVVRIQTIDEQGIVADDPAGPTVLQPGAANNISWGNGNNRRWLWKDIENHHFRYVGAVTAR